MASLNPTNPSSVQRTDGLASRPLGFFNLPREIRNDIYDLIIQKTTPDDNIIKRAVRVDDVQEQIPRWIKNFMRASPRVRYELLPLIFGNHTWVADLYFDDIDRNKIRVAQKGSWLRTSGSELLNGNIHHVKLRLKHRFPRSETQRAERDLRINKWYALGNFSADIDIRLLRVVPHFSTRVDIHIRIPLYYSSVALLEAELNAALSRSIRAELTDLVSAKQSLRAATTRFTIAEWNQVVDTVETAFKTWFMNQDWTPWGRVKHVNV